jgi:inosine-uridine nucleoside N-ribohydrolase
MAGDDLAFKAGRNRALRQWKGWRRFTLGNAVRTMYRYRYGLRPSHLLSLVVCLMFSLPGIGSPRQVIIDTDPGTDDAIAILLALSSPELDVRALTVVPGNVTAAQGLDNARRLLSLAQRCDVPVAAGAKRPLVAPLITGELWHGKNGLGDVQLPAPICPVDKRWAPDLIIEMVHAAPHEITLITLGPLTNIALAAEKDPSIVPLIKEVIMMGGSISGGNITPAAEFNIHVDPEAAQIVFESGWPVTMVGLDVCRHALLTRDRLNVLSGERGKLATFVFAIGNFLLQGAERKGASGSAMYDPLAVGVAIDRTVVGVSAMRVEVETAGRLTRGETVADPGGAKAMWELRRFPDGERLVFTGVEPLSANAAVATTVQSERFLDLLLARLRGK